MKKIIIFILLIVNVFSYENEFTVKIKKETNGNYMIAMPSMTYQETSGYFIHKVDLDLLFSAPRSDFINLNHYGVLYNNHFGLATTDFFITMSLDLKYIFEGNDYREEPG